MTTDFEAVQWREYVRNPRAWNEAAWEAALKKGLAVKRGDKWTLTDAGLDLFNAGNIAPVEVAESGLQLVR